MRALMKLLAILCTLPFLFTDSKRECYQYEKISVFPANKTVNSSLDTTCVTQTKLCISYVFATRKKSTKEIILRGDCVKKNSTSEPKGAAWLCSSLSENNKSCFYDEEAHDALLAMNDSSISLLRIRQVFAVCCCNPGVNGSKCNAPNSVLKERPIDQCYNYEIDIRYDLVDSVMLKEKCPASSYCSSALVRHTSKDGTVTEARGSCHGLRYQSICDRIGERCIYGDQLTEFFEEVDDYFKSQPIKWDVFCCCKGELCNTAMAVIQIGTMNTCYHYKDMLINSTQKKMDRERCASDYCATQLLSSTHSGLKNYMIRLYCTEKSMCDDLQDKCVFAGNEHVNKVQQGASAIMSRTHGKNVTAIVHALCCCKGDRCNTKEAVWYQYSAAMGVTAPTKSSDIKHYCLEYDFNPEDGGNASKAISKQKCLSESEYCLSRFGMVTTLAFGKTKPWLIGNCAVDENEEQLCKQMGAEGGCLRDEAAAQSELGKMFLEREQDDAHMLELKTVCCCKGDNCNTVDLYKTMRTSLNYSENSTSIFELPNSTMTTSSANVVSSALLRLFIAVQLVRLLRTG